LIKQKHSFKKNNKIKKNKAEGTKATICVDIGMQQLIGEKEEKGKCLISSCFDVGYVPRPVQ